MKRIYGAGVKELVEVVQKRKVIKKIKGKRYLCEYPKFNKDRVPTPNQLRAREKFKKCAAYANKAIKDPAIKAAYGLNEIERGLLSKFSYNTLGSTNAEMDQTFGGFPLGDYSSDRRTDPFFAYSMG